MNVRESLNSHQGVWAAVAAVAVLGCGWMIFHQMHPPGDPPPITVFYTDDDGATWFADSPSNVPPYDHNGKQAVRCSVYEGGGKTFVGYMKEFSPPVAHKMKANLGTTDTDLATGTLVKRPGDKNWIPMNDLRSQAIVNAGAGAIEIQP
jgi:hypothetical protein